MGILGVLRRYSRAEADACEREGWSHFELSRL